MPNRKQMQVLNPADAISIIEYTGDLADFFDRLADGATFVPEVGRSMVIVDAEELRTAARNLRKCYPGVTLVE